MKKLVNIELSKLFSRVSTYIIFAVSIGLVVLSIAIGQFANQSAIQATLYGVTDALILGAIIINMIMSDVHKGTMKNIVGAGISRDKIFLSKLVASFIAVFLIELVHNLFAVVYGFVAVDGFVFGSSELMACGIAVVVLLLYTILLVSISFLISGSFGSALTIILGIFLPMASALTLLNNQAVTLVCGAEPTYLASTIFNDGLSAQSGIQLVCVAVVFVAIAVISMTMFKKKEIK